MKNKLPSIISIAIILGFIYWIMDAFIVAYFNFPYSFPIIWHSFLTNLKVEPNVYSRLIAIIMFIFLGLISHVHKKELTRQNSRLKKLKKELVEINKKLREFLFRDQLTGAINRNPFIELLDKKISDSKRNNKKLSLYFLDIIKFKNLNDKYGHGFGDKVLIHSYYKIRGCLRQGDYVGRYGGDEFILCISDFNKRSDLSNIALKISNKLSEQIEIEGKIIEIKANIGIAVYPEDGNNSNDLLKNSDIAMYKAKREKLSFKFCS